LAGELNTNTIRISRVLSATFAGYAKISISKLRLKEDL
jgi:hypothetical protein